MTRIYYKQWITNYYCNEMFVNVDSISVPDDGLDIVITADKDTIEYLNEIFGGSISEDKRHLLLAKMPEDIIKYRELPATFKIVA